MVRIPGEEFIPPYERRCRKKPEPKQATIEFLREQLLYDVRNYAYVEGDIMQGEEHDKHQVQDVGEDGNVDRVTRVLNTAFSEVVEFCYPYSKTPAEKETTLNDALVETEKYELRLQLPHDFSQTSLPLLRDQIHEYLVCTAVADWMSITKPDSQANWQAKAEVAEGKVKSLLHGRIGRIRRKLNPF